MVGWQSLLLGERWPGQFPHAVDKGGAYFRTRSGRARGVVLDYDNDGQMDLLVGLMGDGRSFFIPHIPATTGSPWPLSAESKSNRPVGIAY